MRKIPGVLAGAGLLAAAAVFAANGEAGRKDAPANAPDVQAQIAALKQEIIALKRELTPDLGQQMLILQIRHARLWFAGEGGDWTLTAYELQELKEAMDAVVAANPEHQAMQPERLADILPAMMRGPLQELRNALDHRDKAAFETAYDHLSAACTGCHAVAGNTFLVIQRPGAPLLDNLRIAPEKH